MFWNRKNEGVVFTQFYKEILKIANSDNSIDPLYQTTLNMNFYLLCSL